MKKKTMVAVVLMLGLTCCGSGHHDSTGKYTPEECAGLLLVANDNGSSHSEQGHAANEYQDNCEHD